MPLYYLPPQIIFAKILQYDEICINKAAKFVKSSFYNRCYLMGANGLLRLSIPLRYGRDSQHCFAQVYGDDKQRWKAIHWRSIVSAYKHAPYFEYYAPYFEEFYIRQGHENIFDFNLEILQVILQLLSVNIKISILNYPHDFNQTESLLMLSPKAFSFPALPEYQQVFMERHGFYSNLSSLDLLFNLGPKAKDYLQMIMYSEHSNLS